MLSAPHVQTDIFFTTFGAQITEIGDELLDPIDEILDDPEIVALVRARLADRFPSTRTTGRPGLAPDRILRSFVLKHVKDWSFRELRRELVDSIRYRRFTHFDADRIPDVSTFSRLFALLDEPVLEAIHTRLLQRAHDGVVAQGRRMCTDTTAVETAIHHPTDSTLLADGIRVITRALARIAEQCVEHAIRVVDHSRAATRRLLEIARAARGRGEIHRDRMEASYRKLLALTKGLTRQAEQTLEAWTQSQLEIAGSEAVIAYQAQTLEHFMPIVRQVIAQTEARILRGDTRFDGKILSLFEPHTALIRKGKAHKPNEFGRLVRIDQVENGIVSGFAVLEGNAGDAASWEPALANHAKVFGRPPHTASADRGYFSAENERLAEDMGVTRVALPARGKLSKTRTARQRKRWFRRAQGWRASLEGRIGTLKNRFGMRRARYKGEIGVYRSVAGAVIANNVVRMARHRMRHPRQPEARA